MRCIRTDVSSFSLRDRPDLRLASVHEDSDPVIAAAERMAKRHADAAKVTPPSAGASHEDVRDDAHVDPIAAAQERMRRRNAAAASR